MRVDRVRESGAAELRCSRRRVVAMRVNQDRNLPAASRLNRCAVQADAASRRRRNHRANRSGACPRRCAAAALRHNVALCKVRHLRAALVASLRSPHNTRYVAGRRALKRTGPALKRCGSACMRPLTRPHPRAQASTGACCARPHAGAHPLTHVRPRVARGRTSRAREPVASSSSLSPSRALRLRVSQGARCCRPSVAPCSARQGQGELLRKP